MVKKITILVDIEDFVDNNTIVYKTIKLTEAAYFMAKVILVEVTGEENEDAIPAKRI